MTGNLITVDRDKCIRCGICVECCPSCILSMANDGPVCDNERGCMGCGHCVAICPAGAMDNKYAPLQNQRAAAENLPSSDMLYEALRSRRSVRNFKNVAPSEEELRSLLEICRYAPTATNSQGIYYLVLRDKEKIQTVAEHVVTWMEEAVAANLPGSKYFALAIQAYRTRGVDIICRNAPCLIIALARRVSRTGFSNAEMCMAYASVYAPSLGLGTTIAGFVEHCGQADYKPLLDFLDVPAKQIIVGAMMVGYPKYKYRRLPERQHLKVEFK
ncbi:MAG: nitroreductase family protein [Acidaminococcaceae bacterium]|nr:nitroreductase family protein [Acidaminococcaceae bacterium]